MKMKIKSGVGLATIYEQQFNDLLHRNVRHPEVPVSVNGQTVRQVKTESTRNNHVLTNNTHFNTRQFLSKKYFRSVRVR